MASAGLGAAQGLESGFRLALQANEQQRIAARQEAQDARQLSMDQLAQEDHARAIAEHQDAKEMNALGVMHGDITAQLKAHQAANSRPPDELLQRAESVAKARDAKLGKASGLSYDPEVLAKEAAVNVDALNKGDLTPFQKKPGSFSQTFTSLTKRQPSLYVRQNGQPAVMEQGANDFEQGMESGDQDRILHGVNVLYDAEINHGIGGPGAHGGTIIAKRAIHLTADPNAPKDDPAVIPTLRVYVNNGKAEASGDEIRARRAMDPDAPPGATGHYDAPMTQGRSSDPSDPTKSISIKKAMENVHHHKDLVELMNTPDAAQLLQADAQSGWDPDRAVRVRQAYGITPYKPKTESYTLKANEIRVTQKVDEQGNVIPGSQVRDEGNAKEGRDEQKIAAIDAMVEDGTLTAAEGTMRKKLLAQTIAQGGKANKFTGGIGGGGAGGGTNAKGGEHTGGLSKEEERLVKAQQASLKIDGARLDSTSDKAEARAEKKYETDMKNATGDKKRAAAEAERTASLKAIDDERKAQGAVITEKNQKLQDRLDVTVKKPTIDKGKPGAAAAAKGDNTKAEYDAMPKGATYQRGGKTYRKT